MVEGPWPSGIMAQGAVIYTSGSCKLRRHLGLPTAGYSVVALSQQGAAPSGHLWTRPAGPDSDCDFCGSIRGAACGDQGG